MEMRKSGRVREFFRSLMPSTEYVDPHPAVRLALRTGQRNWPTADGGTLSLTSPDDELRMTPAQRWARHNAKARAAGCKCGRPGRLVRSYPVTDAMFEVYACDEHADVTRWQTYGDAWIPLWEHPQPCPQGENWGGSGPIGQPLTHFACPHRTHEVAS